MARIIVIDDTPDVRDIVRRALVRQGHQVIEASDGAAGLKLLAADGADLVITDIFMPGEDGISVARRMRKEFPTVKLIAMSGGGFGGQVDLRPDMRLLGAAWTIAKPFAPEELVDLVRAVLEGRSPC